MEIRISKLARQHAKSVSEIRKQAYLKAYGSNVDVHYLGWGPSDERHQNLGLFLNEQLISVFRIDLIKDEQEFKTQIQTNSEKLNLQLPVVALCRAATKNGYEKNGWHHVLRYAAMLYVLDAGTQKIVSTCMASSPWALLFKEMGYEIYEHTDDWNSFLKPEGKKLVNILDLSLNHKKALCVLGEYIKNRFSQHRNFLEQYAIL